MNSSSLKLIFNQSFIQSRTRTENHKYITKANRSVNIKMCIEWLRKLLNLDLTNLNPFYKEEEIKWVSYRSKNTFNPMSTKRSFVYT